MQRNIEKHRGSFKKRSFCVSGSFRVFKQEFLRAGEGIPIFI